jgi:hypothetical protein
MLILSLYVTCQSYGQARIESEYKISVPNEQQEAVWSFLQSTFVHNAEGILPENISTEIATEIFYDTYFDDTQETLLNYQAGARYRERYVQDSLIKTLLQLKVPTLDELGIARKEHKFSPETNFDINDRTGLHPFLRHIKQKDVNDVDLILGQFGTTSRKMQESIKLKQVRRRIYISDPEGALMTFTMDEVSAFHFPYTQFVELELELNEVRYTDADFVEQAKLEKMNAKAKDAIFIQFENIEQDQTPKYNKMHAALSAQPSAWIYNNLMYLLLGCISMCAITLLIKNESRFANI